MVGNNNRNKFIIIRNWFYIKQKIEFAPKISERFRYNLNCVTKLLWMTTADGKMLLIMSIERIFWIICYTRGDIFLENTTNEL